LDLHESHIRFLLLVLKISHFPQVTSGSDYRSRRRKKDNQFRASGDMKLSSPLKLVAFLGSITR
jgi:hypothetical protein